MERDWERYLKEGKKVDVKIKFAYDGVSEVPKQIFGEYSVNGTKNPFNFRN
ncbi:hypothetical protein [Photobacterium kishitanii]|uniref:hypothetical protein n=1 Tax=Photobacterium kishitanii TaxID=318456 RepID=UPI000D151F8A